MIYIWFLMVLTTVILMVACACYLGFTIYHDIYDYVCDELDHCKYFGD